MQTVKHRCCAYGNALGEPMPPGHELLRTCKFVRRIRYSRAQGAMRAAPIVMSNPLLQDQPKVPLRYRNYPVKAFAPNCPDHSFANRVCERGGDFNTARPSALIESSTGLAKMLSRS